MPMMLLMMTKFKLTGISNVGGRRIDVEHLRECACFFESVVKKYLQTNMLTWSSKKHGCKIPQHYNIL